MHRVTVAVLIVMAAIAALIAGSLFISRSVFAQSPSHFPNGTVSAATCGRDDVQTAINNATDGQIVLIPAGTCIWNSGVTVSGKGIYVKGQNDLSTHLRFAAAAGTLIDIVKDDTHHVALGFIDFQYASGSGVYILVRGTGKPFLVHDNAFDANAAMAHVMRIQSNGGVFWSNTVTNGDTSRGNLNGIVQLNMMSETASWTNPPTFGSNDVNGTANTYLEDNTYTRTLQQSFDCDNNARVVFRYNTLNDAAAAVHGQDTSAYGCRQWEVYNNTFRRISNNYPINRWIYVRGASGVFTDNTLDEADSPDHISYSNKVEIDLTVQNLRRAAGPNPCCDTYPCRHQVGQSTDMPDPTPDEPVAIWNNLGPGTSSPNYITPTNYPIDECGGGPDVSGFIQSGRDYITSAKTGYTKFAYPHPLRTGA
jgi:hypothetical protein